MPRLYNVDAYPIVIDHSLPAVQPGDGWDFTPEQIAGGITGVWSEIDPRAGLEEERAWKRKRDSKPVEVEIAGPQSETAQEVAAAPAAEDSPADAGDTKEN